MKGVFICHSDTDRESEHDRELLRKIKSSLAALEPKTEIRVVSREDLEPDGDLNVTMRGFLDSAQVAVLLVSQAFHDSPQMESAELRWIAAASTAASDRRLRIISFILNQCSLNGVIGRIINQTEPYFAAVKRGRQDALLDELRIAVQRALDQFVFPIGEIVCDALSDDDHASILPEDQAWEQFQDLPKNPEWVIFEFQEWRDLAGALDQAAIAKSAFIAAVESELDLRPDIYTPDPRWARDVEVFLELVNPYRSSLSANASSGPPAAGDAGGRESFYLRNGLSVAGLDRLQWGITGDNPRVPENGVHRSLLPEHDRRCRLVRVLSAIIGDESARAGSDRGNLEHLRQWLADVSGKYKLDGGSVRPAGPLSPSMDRLGGRRNDGIAHGVRGQASPSDTHRYLAFRVRRKERGKRSWELVVWRWSVTKGYYVDAFDGGLKLPPDFSAGVKCGAQAMKRALGLKQVKRKILDIRNEGDLRIEILVSHACHESCDKCSRCGITARCGINEWTLYKELVPLSAGFPVVLRSQDRQALENVLEWNTDAVRQGLAEIFTQPVEKQLHHCGVADFTEPLLFSGKHFVLWRSLLDSQQWHNMLGAGVSFALIPVGAPSPEEVQKIQNDLYHEPMPQVPDWIWDWRRKRMAGGVDEGRGGAGWHLLWDDPRRLLPDDYFMDQNWR